MIMIVLEIHGNSIDYLIVNSFTLDNKAVKPR